MIRVYIYIFGMLLVGGCGDFLSTTANENSQSQEVICDNGLQDWLNSSSDFGQWVAKSTRIVKIGRRKYQPQFKDCKDEKAEWIALFEGDSYFGSLPDAQWKIRWGFLIKKGVCDAFQDLGKKD